MLLLARRITIVAVSEQDAPTAVVNVQVVVRLCCC